MMKNLQLVAIFFTIFFLVHDTSTEANTAQKAYEIMKKVDERYDGDDKESEMIVVLIDKTWFLTIF